MWIPLALWKAVKEGCWSQGWSSIWWAAGGMVVEVRRRESSAWLKLEMPIAFVLPLLRVFSMALSGWVRGGLVMIF